MNKEIKGEKGLFCAQNIQKIFRLKNIPVRMSVSLSLAPSL